MSVATLKRTEQPMTPKAKKLRGPEKAAILFLCLGESRGSGMMQKLDAEDIEKITRAMAGLGVIEAPTVEEVLSEFTDGVTNGGGVVGSFAVAENMLRSFLPADKVENILKDIRGPLKERDLWARFSSMSEAVIANYLKGEHEQTVAAILSNVKPDVAAKVLPLLGQAKMEDVIERMIRMEAVPHHMMQQIEETLQSDIINAASQPTSAEIHSRLAELFNKLDSEAFEKVSVELEKRIPETFNAIKQKMFTFDDLIRLDAMSLARIMRGVPGNTLPLALRGASQELREVFLKALPGRSRDMLLEEINTMGPVRGSEVRAAQVAMVDYTKELAENDIIKLPMDDEDDQLI